MDKVFAYVILHYQNMQVTMDCVKSILRYYSNSKIIIVDNCSPNQTGALLKKEFEGEPRVVVLINDKNKGFAAGNNMGYQYAKKELSPDYIVVSNSDVVFVQKESETVIDEYMEKNRVDVCGPDIQTPDGGHQNPFAYRPYTTEELNRFIVSNKKKLLLFKLPGILSLYTRYRRKHAVQLSNPKKEDNSIINCLLHGSFVVFSKSYIQNEEYAFRPETFMYGEENILYDYLQYRGYRTGYCPDATIIHLGGKSTGTENLTKEKVLFKFTNITKSLKIQLNLRKAYEAGS